MPDALDEIRKRVLKLIVDRGLYPGKGAIAFLSKKTNIGPGRISYALTGYRHGDAEFHVLEAIEAVLNDPTLNISQKKPLTQDP